MTFGCLSLHCKFFLIVMSQREDVHLYCPAFIILYESDIIPWRMYRPCRFLLTVISLSREGLLPCLVYSCYYWYHWAGRIYCPALYILADITELEGCIALFCTSLLSDITLGEICCPAWYIFADSDFTSGRIYCPA